MDEKNKRAKGRKLKKEASGRGREDSSELVRESAQRDCSGCSSS